MQLSVNLVGVISQTLLRRKDGRGRVAAYETLVATGAVRNLIRENKTFQISSLIQTGSRAKMQSLDQSMAKLVDMGIVTHEDAKARAKDPGEFERLINLGKSASPSPAAAQQVTPAATPVQTTSSQSTQTPPAAPPTPPIRGAQFRPGYQSK
jgi:twitching motility protein PilT